MSRWKMCAAAAAALIMAVPAIAQDEGESAVQVERDVRRIQTRDSAPRAETMEVQMREAEEQLAEAAARVAELSRSRLPEMARHFAGSMHPVMGITIGANDDTDGPVEGVEVNGVTPGSAAADAGLRAGDVITSINGESFGAGNGESASRKLLDFMQGVEEGDALAVEYLRDGRTASVEVRPRPAQHFAFSFMGNPMYGVPAARVAPGVPVGPPDAGFFSFFGGGGSWGDMEMVSLTEDLGRYFGTDKGLLVVRAPEDDSLKLRDGDVIRSIDGREPGSVSHAMRILGSYQGGETLKIEIMRDKKRQTVSVEMPDNRRSGMREFGFAAPAASVAPGALAVQPDGRDVH